MGIDDTAAISISARASMTVLRDGRAPHNNEMQRTKRGRDGASPLISVFCGLDASSTKGRIRRLDLFVTRSKTGQ